MKEDMLGDLVLLQIFLLTGMGNKRYAYEFTHDIFF